MKKERFSFVNLLDPTGVVQVLENKWFWCEDGDPTKGVVFDKFSPQCNSNKRIAETFSIGRIFPSAKLIFVEKCFVPWDCSEHY